MVYESEKEKRFCEILYKTIKCWQEEVEKQQENNEKHRKIVFPSLACFISPSAREKVLGSIKEKETLRRVLNKIMLEYEGIYHHMCVVRGSNDFLVYIIQSANYLFEAMNMLIYGLAFLEYFNEYEDFRRLNEKQRLVVLSEVRPFFDSVVNLLYNSRLFLAKFIKDWLSIEFSSNKNKSSKIRELPKKLYNYFRKQEEKFLSREEISVKKEWVRLFEDKKFESIIKYRNDMVHFQRQKIKGLDYIPDKLNDAEKLRAFPIPRKERNYKFSSLEEFCSVLANAFNLYSDIFIKISTIFENNAIYSRFVKS